ARADRVACFAVPVQSQLTARKPALRRSTSRGPRLSPFQGWHCAALRRNGDGRWWECRLWRGPIGLGELMDEEIEERMTREPLKVLRVTPPLRRKLPFRRGCRPERLAVLMPVRVGQWQHAGWFQFGPGRGVGICNH